MESNQFTCVVKDTIYIRVPYTYLSIISFFQEWLAHFGNVLTDAVHTLGSTGRDGQLGGSSTYCAACHGFNPWSCQTEDLLN